MSQLLQCHWGSYSHDVAENRFLFTSRVKHSRLGRIQSIVTRVTLWGVKVAASQSLLSTEIENLEAAYSVDGKDFRVKFADGTNTPHKLLSGGSLDGVQVKEFVWLDKDPRHNQSGTEYVNRRSYRIVLEAEGIASGAFALLYWNEELTGIGTGGPEFILKTALVGAPQKQVLVSQTPSIVIQRGQALGYTDWPNVPPPKFPNDEHLSRRRIMIGTPQKFGAITNRLFPVTWYYEFESPTLLSGLPTFF